MTEEKTTMPLAEAKDIAIAIYTKLQPYTDRINIAGSIRRKKPFVGDIEIVCQPKMVSMESADLFGKIKTDTWVNDAFRAEVKKLGEVLKGEPTGRYMQIMLQRGIKLDLFMPQPFDYCRQYAIRTGSANYSKLIIAGGWLRAGWCGTDEGLRKISQCKEKRQKDGKVIWVCDHPNPDTPPHWQSEEEFFKFIGVPWIRPERREIV